MRFIIALIILASSLFASASNYNPWSDWKEYKTFNDSEGRPVVVISYKTKFSDAGIARIKWKIKNAATIPAIRLGIDQKFYQSSDGTTKIVSGDSVYGSKKKPIPSGDEREFQADLFSSDNHGEVTRIELRYPFFNAEFLQSDGKILKISGGSFEAPTRGVIDCREKFGQPNIATEFAIEMLDNNKIKISSTGNGIQTNGGDLTFDLTTYLTSTNKKAFDKAFKSQFSSYATGICGNKINKGVVREAFDIIRAAIQSYGKSAPKKLMIKPRDPITGIRG